jgi:hypothetical protein
MKASRCIIMVMLAIVSGCGPAKKVMETQKDSVAVIIRDSTIFRDSIIYVKVEAEKDSVVLPDTDTSRLSTRYAESEAYVSKGQLHHSLRNKSEALIPIETKIPITIHFESKATIRDKRIVEVVEVEKQLSRWQRFIMALGYGALGLLAGWIAIRLSKIIR